MLLRALLAGILLTSGIRSAAGQTSASSGEGVDQSNLYVSMVFLTQHARDAARRATGGVPGPTAAQRAAQLGIKPGELQALDQNALRYVNEDRRVRAEALRYYGVCRAARRIPDRAAVHSFTLMRVEAASAAFGDLKGKLSPGSYAALRAHIESVFQASLKVQNVR